MKIVSKIFYLLCLFICVIAFPESLFAKKMPVNYLETDDPRWEKVLSARVKLNFRGESVEEVFKKFEKITGKRFDVIFEKDAIEKTKPVVLSVKGTTLRETLWFLSRKYRYDLKWGLSGKNSFLYVRVLDPSMKKKKIQLFFGLLVIAVLLLFSAAIIFRKKPKSNRLKPVESLENVPDEDIIIQMATTRQNDFIYQMLAIDQLANNMSIEGRTAIISILGGQDALMKKIAFAKLKKRFTIEHLVNDIEKITQEELKAVKKEVFKNIEEEK
ncbi:MAG: hypothetical protein KAI43_05255 [Candidatus Aureabacteria bacterium]|nr:hypothetical protein [Candidatus Auribacterota bacterium]